MKPPGAVVMNMFYTGLGIARSLGERRVPVIGLTARHRIHGNFTRYAKCIFVPDSRKEPEALLERLLELGPRMGRRVIFPTRDDDVLFLDRYRGQLERYFILAIPESTVVNACLNKWETHQWAQKAGIAAPRGWLVEEAADLHRILGEVTYPCVLKPVASHHWHQGNNWELVGARKAICVTSRRDLLEEYAMIARADKRVLIQEMIPGGDECLMVTACYLDRKSNWLAGFNAQKLVQTPEGVGTGCIVQSVDRPELFDPTLRLLQAMRFTGIAEVEYKWNSGRNEYQLIEINSRAWDQHRLGNACGTDLVYLAYCEHAGLPMPVMQKRGGSRKWVAEDAFLMAALQLLWRRDPKLKSWVRLLAGKRVYAVWSARDPLPSIAYLLTSFIPGLVGLAWQFSRIGSKRAMRRFWAFSKGGAGI